MENNLKLIDCVNAVAEFHDSFGIPNKYSPIAKVDEKDLKLRYSLMKEENEEYLQAAKEGDLTEIADALGDMLYICLLYTSPSPRDRTRSRMPSSA